MRGGQKQKSQQSLMMTLAGNAAIARPSGKATSAALLPGLRVTVWATSQKGGALVATRDGVGGANARAQQEAKRAVRRQNDQATRQKMQGSGSSGGGNKGKK